MDKQNTDAQKRLEKIISESNEQNFVTRIIDFETQYLVRLEKAGLEVLDYSQTYTLVDAIQKAEKSDGDVSVTAIYTQFTQAYTHLTATYFSGMMVVDGSELRLRDMDTHSQVSQSLADLLFHRLAPLYLMLIEYRK